MATQDIIKKQRYIRGGSPDANYGPFDNSAAANAFILNTVDGDGVPNRKDKKVKIGNKEYWWVAPYEDSNLVEIINLSPFLQTKDGPQDSAYIDSNDWCIWAINNGMEYPPLKPVTVGYSQLDAKLKAVIDGQPLDDGLTYLQSAKQDLNGWATDVTYLDNTKFGPVFQIKETDLPQATRDKIYIENGLSFLAEATVDSNGWAVNALYSNGGFWPPVATNTTSSTGAASTEVWYNHYPNIPKYLKRFFTLFTSSQTPERPITVDVESNSVMVREEHTSAKNVVPNSWPPGMITKNIGAYMYEAFIKLTQATIYHRYDKPAIFTETGAFNTVTLNAAWDDCTVTSGGTVVITDRPTETRCSTATNAALAFSVPAAITYFNFIDRASTEGAVVVTITLAGNGLAQIKNSSGVWVEANGYTFTQRQTPSSANRIGNTIYQRYQFLKNLSGADLLVTISKAAGTSEMLMYWGVQYIPINTESYVIFQALGRGGHTLEELKPYMETDVILRNPDLVVLEIPLLNMVAAGNTLSYVLNWVQDFIYGDRVGATNTWSLKARSNNWQNFELLVIIPHISNGRWNSDGSPKISSTGATSRAVWNAVKSFLFDRGDLAVIDMSNAFMRVADADFAGNNYNATIPSGVTGGSLLNDGTHANDKGTLVYAKHICPVFDLNTY